MIHGPVQTDQAQDPQAPDHQGGAAAGSGGSLARLLGWAILLGVVVPGGDRRDLQVRAAAGRYADGGAGGAGARGWDYHWRPIDKISPALVEAAVASEDARFCDHHGFDFDAIHKAMEHNEKHPNHIRGASTITQQTAKNVFLWPGRDWVRKGFEAYFTVLIEALWGK